MTESKKLATGLLDYPRNSDLFDTFNGSLRSAFAATAAATGRRLDAEDLFQLEAFCLCLTTMTNLWVKSGMELPPETMAERLEGILPPRISWLRFPAK